VRRFDPIEVETMMTRAFGCCVFAVMVAALPLGAASAAPREHVVVKITTLPGATARATVTLPNGRPQVLAVQQSIPDGARVDVPLGVFVVLASSGSKSTTTLRPDTSFTPLSTGAGESSKLHHGSALFSVVHGALDFFQVKYGEKFTASAKGTVFSVSAAAAKVTFACESGQLAVAYRAKLQLRSAKKEAVRAVGGEAGSGAALAASVEAPPEIHAIEVITPATKPRSFTPDAPEFVKQFGTPADAEKVFRRELAAAQYSGDPERIAAAYNNLGTVDAAAGDYDRAVRDFGEAIRHDPQAAIPYYNRGTVRLKKQDVASAIRDYDDAIRLDPELAAAYLNRGAAYDLAGDHDRAIGQYDAALAFEPKNAIAYYDRGNAHLFKGDLVAAIADYGRAIENAPALAIAYVNRGVAAYYKNDYPSAKRDFSDAIRLDPSNALAYVDQGTLFETLGDRAGALADYAKAIELDPKASGAYSRRGAVYDFEGDHERAIADYKKAIELNPALPLNYANRGVSYLAVGDRQRAEADFDSAIQRMAGGVAGAEIVYDLRGINNLYGGSLERARADFEKAASLAPTNVRAALFLDLADRRAKRPSRLAQAVPRLDMSGWPAPVVRVFLGQATPDSAVAAAREADAASLPIRLCEAYYFNAELALLGGSKDEARRLYGLSLHACPTFQTRAILKAAIRALGTP
jgi:tetratricopeptide (TPR) repeat protein